MITPEFVISTKYEPIATKFDLVTKTNLLTNLAAEWFSDIALNEKIIILVFCGLQRQISNHPLQLQLSI